MDPVADGVLCLQITEETLQQKKKCRQRVSTKAPVSEREGIWKALLLGNKSKEDKLQPTQ